MPTFDNPIADAEESAEAVRGLAHATRAMNPADIYGVLGDVTSLTRSLHQVTQQLATAYEANKGRAFDDDGSPIVGERSALSAWMELRQAAGLLSQVEDHLNTAFSHAGRIAWQPDTGPTPPRPQYVLLRELFGGAAKRALTVLSALGEADAFDYLTNRGDEARLRQEALETGTSTRPSPRIPATSYCAKTDIRSLRIPSRRKCCSSPISTRSSTPSLGRIRSLTLPLRGIAGRPHCRGAFCLASWPTTRMSPPSMSRRYPASRRSELDGLTRHRVRGCSDER